MLKYRFFNDYSEGAHPRILEWMASTNLDQEEGYGNDQICLQVVELLRTALGKADAAVHFVTGGTQANLIGLSALLKPYESVIAAESGHIAVHETGAVEATGHKINTVPVRDGKLTAAQIQAVVDAHTDEHMVKPRVVFISQSTELGTLYRLAELEEIARTCRANGLYLYVDGARLGAALTSRAADVTLPDLARLADMFYIGGTKNGALLGEAMVIPNPALLPEFRYMVKQHGGLLAKGRVLGLQFLGLFQEGLYFDLARHANAMAERMAQGIAGLGFTFLTQPTTNILLPIFPDELIARLQQLYGCYLWAPTGEGRSAVRMVTSWATRPDKVEEFLADLKALAG